MHAPSARPRHHAKRAAKARERRAVQRVRHVSVWMTVAILALSFVMANGLDVLHFAVVSHQWCALHEQFEHLHGSSTTCTTVRAADMPVVSSSNVGDRPHGREAGCVFIGAQHERAATLSELVLPVLLSMPAAATPRTDVDVVEGTPRLSLAPKRSPPDSVV